MWERSPAIRHLSEVGLLTQHPPAILASRLAALVGRGGFLIEKIELGYLQAVKAGEERPVDVAKGHRVMGVVSKH